MQRSSAKGRGCDEVSQYPSGQPDFCDGNVARFFCDLRDTTNGGYIDGIIESSCLEDSATD